MSYNIGLKGFQKILAAKKLFLQWPDFAYKSEMFLVIRGGSRILGYREFKRYNFVKFSKNLHKIENILDLEGKS